MKKIIETTEKSLRLNQYLALYGFCSRRLADELIRQGDVTINHWVTKKPSYLVQEKDAVRINKKLIKPTAHQPLYIVLNKPIGFVTTARDEKGRATVLDLIGKQPQRVFPVGRLDITTSGVLLLTNDGPLAEVLAHPSNEIEKVYQVTLDRPVNPEHIKAITRGLFLKDGRVTVDSINQSQRRNKVKISLHSGRNRVVRRIFETLGYTVEKLERINFAGITKKGLAAGQWRFLTNYEVALLREYTKTA